MLFHFTRVCLICEKGGQDGSFIKRYAGSVQSSAVTFINSYVDTKDIIRPLSMEGFGFTKDL